MKLLLLALCLPFCSCALRVNYPNGQPALVDHTDFEGSTELEATGFKFKRVGRQDASKPTRTAMDGVTKIGVVAGGRILGL